LKLCLPKIAFLIYGTPLPKVRYESPALSNRFSARHKVLLQLHAPPQSECRRMDIDNSHGAAQIIAPIDRFVRIGNKICQTILPAAGVSNEN